MSVVLIPLTGVDSLIVSRLMHLFLSLSNTFSLISLLFGVMRILNRPLLLVLIIALLPLIVTTGSAAPHLRA